jgi:hypothetical protein
LVDIYATNGTTIKQLNAVTGALVDDGDGTGRHANKSKKKSQEQRQKQRQKQKQKQKRDAITAVDWPTRRTTANSGNCLVKAVKQRYNISEYIPFALLQYGSESIS